MAPRASDFYRHRITLAENHDEERSEPAARTARGDHRRHLGTRARTGRGLARRAARSWPSSPATRTASPQWRTPIRAATASSATSRARTRRIAIALQISAALGGLDVLVNNASSLGPVPLALLADTAGEDLEAAFATNLLGPFRLTQALLGALAAAAREHRPRAALVVNVISDAAVTPYPSWGAYGASKAALLQLSRIWDAELREHGVRVVAFDPGDMDTPLHALALPDADRATLKRPSDAARELVALIEDAGARTPARPR